MRVVFTICSNNYLAQAKALGDSLTKHNPDYKFIIGLVDKYVDKIDYKFLNPYEIIPIEEIGIEGFDIMFKRYDITELNTAVKPYIFDFLFRRDQQINSIIYLDPDILVFDRFTDLEYSLLDNNIVLTPHFFTPIYDKLRLSEPDILNAGLYNLGFIAIKRSEESGKMLKWWMIKLKDQCLHDMKNGLFVDQLWINFVPLYYEKVFILSHLGYNVAYWNLHERSIAVNNKTYTVNNSFPLVFYHFSGYLLNHPHVISKYQTRYSFEQRSDVLPLFEEYQKILMSNNHQKFSVLPCYYIQEKQKLIAENKKKDSDLIKAAKFVRDGIRKTFGIDIVYIGK